jgi:CHAT domain-containing protein
MPVLPPRPVPTTAALLLLAASILPGQTDDRTTDAELRALEKQIRSVTDSGDVEALAALGERLDRLAGRLPRPEDRIGLRLAWANAMPERDPRAFAAIEAAHADSRQLENDDAHAGLRARACAARAGVHAIRGELDEAAALHETAIELFGAAGERARLADALMRRSGVLTEMGRHGEALAGYERARVIYVDLDDDVGLARAATGRADTLNASGRYEEALAAYTEAEPLFESAGDAAGLARLRANRGTLYVRSGRYVEAEAAYARATEYYRSTGDETVLAGLSMNRGNILASLGRYDEALSCYSEAEGVFERLGNARVVAQIAMNRAFLHKRLSHYDDAIAAYAVSGRYLERLGDDESIGSVAMGRGNLLSSLGRYVEALAEYARARRAFEKVDNLPSLARLSVNRADVLDHLGRDRDALAAYEEAAAVSVEIGDTSTLVACQLRRGMLELRLLGPDAALARFAEAESTLETQRNEDGLAHLALLRARALSAADRTADALAELDRAAATFRELGNQGALGSVALDRGRVLGAIGRDDEAVAALKVAVACFERTGEADHLASARAALGRQHLRAGRAASALACFVEVERALDDVLLHQAQGVGPEASEGFRSTFDDLAAKALECASRLLADAKPTGGEATEGPHEHPAANDLRGDPDRVRRETYAILQSIEGLGAAELLAEHGRMRSTSLPAELATEVARRRAALDAAVAKRDELTARPASSIEELRARKDGLDRALQGIDAARRALDEAVEAARVENPVYVDASYPRAAPLARVQSSLPAGSALVEYIVGDESAWACVTTRESVSFVPLGASAPIDASARTLADALANPEFAPTSAELRQLGRLVLDPVLASLDAAATDTLFVRPDGPLCRIPIETLLVADVADTVERTTWPYLVARVNVAYVHSGTSLVAQRERNATRPTASGPRFVAFAHPELQSPGGSAPRDVAWSHAAATRRAAPLTAIPGTAKEVLGVARLFASEDETRAIDAALRAFEEVPLRDDVARLDGARFCIRLRHAADERSLESESFVRDAAIVHLACHGQADLESPSLSRLWLAPAQDDDGSRPDGSADGLVYLRDLRDLDLSCDLLVLSACESTTGRLSQVDGMKGLARAGLASGAGAILSTLWRVDDEAARDLVLGFYRRLVEREPDARIAALAAAKRDAIARGVVPSSWSAYVLWDAGR